MGTNYYAVHDSCDHCGRSERLHICKSLISFHGVFTEADLDYEPWLVSWADWKTYLRSGQVDRVDDEYGNEHDIAEFVRRVEATSPEARRSQYDWCVAHPNPHRPPSGAVVPGGDWLDPDGYSFYGGEFS